MNLKEEIRHRTRERDFSDTEAVGSSVNFVFEEIHSDTLSFFFFLIEGEFNYND